MELSNNEGSNPSVEEEKKEVSHSEVRKSQKMNRMASLQEQANFTVTLMSKINIETDYILTSHLDEWQRLYKQYSFSVDQSSWDLR